ncbi:MAG: hypothetical protein ACOCWQ_03810 [Nanoarchaeota archaeon]
MSKKENILCDDTQIGFAIVGCLPSLIEPFPYAPASPNTILFHRAKMLRGIHRIFTEATEGNIRKMVQQIEQLSDFYELQGDSSSRAIGLLKALAENDTTGCITACHQYAEHQGVDALAQRARASYAAGQSDESFTANFTQELATEGYTPNPSVTMLDHVLHDPTHLGRATLELLATHLLPISRRKRTPPETYPEMTQKAFRGYLARYLKNVEPLLMEADIGAQHSTHSYNMAKERTIHTILQRPWDERFVADAAERNQLGLAAAAYQIATSDPQNGFSQLGDFISAACRQYREKLGKRQKFYELFHRCMSDTIGAETRIRVV